MRQRTRFALAVAATGAAAAHADAQVVIADSSAILAGVVIAKHDGAPLPYSVVSLPGVGNAGRERYTSARGAFAFPGLPPGLYRLRVKHLGYAPTELDVRVSAGRTEVRVELTRVALRLATVRVVAREACRNPGPPDPAITPELATLFEQLRQNAERLRLLVDRHPYRYFVERTFHERLRNGETRLAAVDTVGFRSDHGWRYKPGRMIAAVGEGFRREYILTIPGLVDLVDSAFLANHCFRYGGTDTLYGAVFLRVDFYAAERLRDPDVDGAAYLDTLTFGIRGVRIALTRPPAVLRAVSGISATTIFEDVVPSIPIPAHVIGTKIFRSTRGPRAPTSAVETQRLLEVRFLGELPGGAPASGPVAPPG